jgi:hypothetical protein
MDLFSWRTSREEPIKVVLSTKLDFFFLNYDAGTCSRPLEKLTTVLQHVNLIFLYISTKNKSQKLTILFKLWTNKNHSYKHNNEHKNNQNIDNSECFGVKFVKIYLEMTSQ